MQKHQIFISYSRENIDKKDQIVTDLIDFGFSIWVDSTNIPYGSPWLAKIQEGIKNSKILLYLGSKQAMESPNVGFELGFATCCKIIIIPTLIKGNNITDGVPEWLRAKQSATTLRGIGQYEQNKSEFFSSILDIIYGEVSDQMTRFVSQYAKLEDLLAILNGTSGEGEELYDDYIKREKEFYGQKRGYISSYQLFNDFCDLLSDWGLLVGGWEIEHFDDYLEQEQYVYHLTKVGQKIVDLYDRQ